MPLHQHEERTGCLVCSLNTFHNAIRGAIPRATVKAVTKATYLQLWWPQMERPVYVHRLPLWDGENYRDPDTGFALPTWDRALEVRDEDPDAKPAHVMHRIELVKGTKSAA